MEQNNNKRDGLLLRAVPPGQGTGTLSGQWLCLLPLTAGLAWILAELFPFVPWWAVLAGGTVLQTLTLLLYHSRVKNWILPAGCLLLIFGCVLLRRQIALSGGTLFNVLLDRLCAGTGRIYLKFKAGGSAAYALVPFGILTMLLLGQAAAQGKLLPALPVLLAVLLGAGLKIVEPGGGWILVLLGVVLLSCGGTNRSLVAARWTVILFCVLLAAGVTSLLRELPSDTWRSSLEDRLHALCYDSESNSMPEGRLANLGPWEKNDTEALAVTMDAPQKLYLRGAVYETYTGTAWEPLSAAERAADADLFYWLHQSGFYGQSQISLAASQLKENAAMALKVENRSACRAQSYLPYGMADSESLDAGLIGDLSSPASVTEMTMLPGGLTEWYALQRDLAAQQDTLSDYLVLEQAYGDYVKKHDLQLTEESWQVLQRQLGADETPRTLVEIQTLIRDYLAEHLRYDESVYTFSGDEDFLHYVLERSGAGYSVQYATAAVLMLRYCGVPARYVEGYYLSAEEAEALAAGETAILTEENAHAWAELYLSGVGFVPFEVTPGYLDPEDLGTTEELENGALYLQSPQEYTSAEQPEPLEASEEPREALRLRSIIWLLAWTILLLVLLTLLVLLLRRRRRLRRALKQLELAENRDAITGRYAYAALLLRRCPGILPERAVEAAAINREAMFSSHTMTDAQREEMERYTAGVVALCQRQWSLLQRLRYRYWDCIFL